MTKTQNKPGLVKVKEELRGDLFVRVVLLPSQPIRVMWSMVSLLNHTFSWAGLTSILNINSNALAYVTRRLIG